MFQSGIPSRVLEVTIIIVIRNDSLDGSQDQVSFVA